MLRTIALLVTILLLYLPVIAQNATPAIPNNPEATLLPVDDPRLALCSAPTLDGFEPYVIRPGDHLGDLLSGVPNISVTQLAALNCLDDPQALPVGAVIWIPAHTIPKTISPAPSAEPEISSLTVASPNFQNQDTFTLSWETTGGTTFFYACPDASVDDCPRPAFAEPVPASGEITISNYRYAGEKRYRLEVQAGNALITEDLTFTITCSQVWLGPLTGLVTCPAEPPRAVFAAWQPFEGGSVLWFSDTSEIWVLTNTDQRVQIFADTFVEGEANPEYAAPADRFTPERGFGKVWQILGGPDSPLGWALAAETGFDSARQAAGSRSYTTYIQGPGTTVYAITLIPQLEVGLWAQVAG